MRVENKFSNEINWENRMLRGWESLPNVDGEEMIKVQMLNPVTRGLFKVIELGIWEALLFCPVVEICRH